MGILKNEENPIPNGVITASEIGAVLQQEVVNQKGVFQRPSYNVIAGSEGGDFIFKVLPEAISPPPIPKILSSRTSTISWPSPKILIPIVAVVIGTVVAFLVFGSGSLMRIQPHQPSSLISINPPRSPPSITNNTDHPPTAITQSITTNMNKAIDVTLAGSDPDENDNLTATIVTPPTRGTLGTINQNTGIVTYTPNSGFVGTDKLYI